MNRRSYLAVVFAILITLRSTHGVQSLMLARQMTDAKESTPAANYFALPDLSDRNIDIYTCGLSDSWGKSGRAFSTLCGIQVVERKRKADPKQ